MAIPPVVFQLISAAATDKNVRKIAGDLATKAYGKLFGESDPIPVQSPQIASSPQDELAALRRDISDRPTRDEFVASFALLEAKFVIEQEKNARLMRGMIVGQLIGVALLTLVLFR